MADNGAIIDTDSGSVDLRRVRRLNDRPEHKGPVIYWMSRDQRFMHNWALLFACEQANRLGKPLEVLFALPPSFLGAPVRHYDFMFRGLREVESRLRTIGIPLRVLAGEPEVTIPTYATQQDASAVITDFSPLKLTRSWKERASTHLPCAFYEVDAHNIVPCWLASAKQEFAARTFRPKLDALLEIFLTPFPSPDARFQPDTLTHPSIRWEALAAGLQADKSVRPVSWLHPGEQAAEKRLRQFIADGLPCYATGRNDPNRNCVLGLSPYLHFGQISAQHITMEIRRSDAPAESRQAFIEELFIRRELAENYCYHNNRYDTFGGIPAWAQKSLMAHASDRREYRYSASEFENAETHDELWNAAETELLQNGRMHGYMRMYWAKKILEWSDNPVAAFDIALALNDRYALDGRDPNGYAGVAWSIGGLHDRPWFDRPVYGRIRYMNASGCARKFNVRRYIDSVYGNIHH
jgi:deoxyribodipyrimidine photo-lyase